MQTLLQGLVTYADTAIKAGLDPIIVAAAFGFVYVHSFEDGSGRPS